MKKSILLLFLLNSVATSLAQDVNLYGKPDIMSEKISPETPSATALIRYIDHPVSYDTGIQDISIPIYTIKTRELELPISISYHASGIKVDDESTEVGLGWSLNAGGMIVKVVNGQPDDKFAGDGGWNIKSRDEIIKSNDVNYLNWLRRSRDVDKEHDRYYYNFGSYKGSFIYNYRQQEIYELPESENKITVNRAQNKIRSIFITVPTGTQYRFELADTVEYNEVSVMARIIGGSKDADANIGNYYKTVLNWKLTKIISANNTDSITFEYEDSGYWEQYLHSKSIVECHREGDVIVKMPCQNEPVHTGGTNDVYQNAGMTNYKYDNNTTLKRIIFNNGSVVFSNIKDRTDEVSPTRVAAITVLNNSEDTIQRTTLNNSNHFSCGRMKLSGVYTYGTGNTLIDKSEFEYNEQFTTPRKPKNGEVIQHELGQSYYYGQDRAGYYNGVTTNVNIIPYNVLRIPQSNMNYSFEYAQNLTLKKIKTITGGYTTYQYEPSVCGTSVGLRVKEIGIWNDTNQLVKKKMYSYATPMSSDMSGLTVDDYIDIKATPYYSYSRMMQVNCSGTGFIFAEIRVVTPRTVSIAHSPHPVLPGLNAKNAQVYYGSVEEIISDNDSKIKTVYNYGETPYRYIQTSHFIPKQGEYSNQPYGLFGGYYAQIAAHHNQLNEKSIYKYIDGRYELQERIKNRYNIYNTKDVPLGIYIKGMDDEDIPDGSAPPMRYLSDYYYFDVVVPSYRKVLASTTKTSYYGDKTIQTEAKYEYDTLALYKVRDELVKSITFTANGKIYKHNYFYPKNYNTPVYREMVARNNISSIIRDEFYINNRFLRSLNNVFSLLEQPDKTLVVRQKSGMSSSYDDRYDIKFVEFLKYTDNGVVAQLRGNDVPNTVYLWGYNNRYPVAEIKNARYEDVVQAIGANVIKEVGASRNLNDSQVAILDSLRELLPDAMVTTYKYESLVGVVNITDPSGRSVRYEYDGANRLKSIVDEDGNIVEAYEYNYQK